MLLALCLPICPRLPCRSWAAPHAGRPTTAPRFRWLARSRRPAARWCLSLPAAPGAAPRQYARIKGVSGAGLCLVSKCSWPLAGTVANNYCVANIIDLRPGVRARFPRVLRHGAALHARERFISQLNMNRGCLLVLCAESAVAARLAAWPRSAVCRASRLRRAVGRGPGRARAAKS